MRSHFLKDLSIDGAKSVLEQIPDFDFYRLHAVVEFAWVGADHFAPNRSTSEVDIKMLYETELLGRVFRIRMQCFGVRQLQLPEVAETLLLSEVEIEDRSKDQLEGIRYEIKDYGQSGLVVLCAEIKLSVL